MDLIKLSTKFYPYTIAELRADYPNVSFPLGLVGVDLAQFDAAEVITDRQPDYDPAVEAIDTLPPKKMKGVWRVRWEKRKLSPAEIRARTPADWEGFADALLEDEEFNCCFGIVFQESPALAHCLIADLGGDPIRLSNFAGRWDKFCRKSEASVGSRQRWADLAEKFSLPEDFTAIVRGDHA